MIEAFSSFVSGVGSVLSGILQVSAWILALQVLFLGLMVLFYGRRSFWVFAAVLGFVLGLWLASRFNVNLSPWAQATLALALGAAGATVGLFAPRPVGVIIGSLALALLGVAVASSLGAATWLQWIVAIALGVAGVYLFWRLLDWALIVGTSLFGALLAALSLTSLFDFARGFGVLPFLLFLVAGIAYQARDRQVAAELKRLRSNAAPVPAPKAGPSAEPLPPAGTAAPLSSPAVAAETLADVSAETNL